MSFTASTDQIYPDNAQGQLVEIPSLPAGATVDNIFYFHITAGGTQNYYKRVLTGPIRAVECKIFGDGTDITDRLQAVADAGVNTLLFDSPVNVNHLVRGDVVLPDDFQMVFNDSKNIIGGTGSISGGQTVCNPLNQCFDLSDGLSVTDSMNTVASVRWFGAIDDYDITVGTVTVDSSIGINAAIQFFKERFDTWSSTGNTIVIPACRRNKRYYCSGNVLVNRVCYVFGEGSYQTQIQFAQGNYMYLPYATSGSIKGIKDGGAWMRDLSVWGSNNGNNEGPFDADKPGIFIQSPLNRFDNVRVIGFNGNAWQIIASTPTYNANCNRFYNCDGIINGGSGMYFQGADANASTILDGNFSSNGICGIYDNSFLGNRIIGVHTSANSGQNPYGSNAAWWAGKNYQAIDDSLNVEPGVGGWATYWKYVSDSVSPPYGYPTWDNTKQYYGGGAIRRAGGNQDFGDIMCYSEGDEYIGKNEGGRTMVIAGTNSQAKRGAWFMELGFPSSNSGVQAINGNENVYMRMESESNRIGWFDSDHNMFPASKFHKTEKMVTIGSANNFGTLRFFFNETSGGYIGRSACGNGMLSSIYGIFNYIYSLDSSRALFGEYIEPTSDSGEHATGDTAINQSPTEFSILGWKCKTAGTPGTFVTIGKGRGATGSRPSFTAATSIGYEYFDTTLGYPIWWNGTIWVKSDGTAA